MTIKNKPEYRFAQRTGFCRACDQKVEKGVDKAVYFYSHMNRGQHIIICPKCVKVLNELVEE